MTRLISAPTETGQLRHYFIRESTLDGWRPQCGEWARLVELLSDARDQAAVGDVVEVLQTVTPPTGFADGVRGKLWLHHRGGSNLAGTQERYGHLTGTIGVWERCYPIVLCTEDGTRLEQLSAEDRVAVLVAAVAELTEGERGELFEKLKELEAKSG